MDKYNYDDDTLTDDMRKHFETCLIELIKANKFTYKRRPNEKKLKSNGQKLIILYSDYSMAWVSLTYLLEEKKDGTFEVTLRQSRSGILHNTIAKGELIALTKAVELHNEVISTVPIEISKDLILTDSQAAIHWTLRAINNEIFVTNHVNSIKQNIQLDKILYCKSTWNLADIGSKFARLNKSNKIITAETVSPTSIYIKGDKNLTNFDESSKNGAFVTGSQMREELNHQVNHFLLLEASEEDPDELKKDTQLRYDKLLKDMRTMYNSRVDKEWLGYVRPFEKIINNTMDKEVNIITIVFTLVEKFKR